MQEYIPLGQRVQEFSVEAFVDGSWKELAKATTIGYKRILRLPTTTASKLRFTINKAKACPVISNIEVFLAPKVYAKPDITRNKQGMVTIASADQELELFYTTDGTAPNINSKRYEAPFELLEKADVKAIALDPITGKESPISSENFDIARKKWQLINIDDENAQSVLDGLEKTSWGQSSDQMPIDLTIDLGEDLNLKGFKYLPDQNRWSSGIIFDYEFYTSTHGKSWKLQNKGEFSNIKNSPIWQTKTFDVVRARYIKLRGLRNTDGNNKAGYAELTVITE